ncbi:TIGR03557 family F420-dependent LLM class oxidoreductase [Knoellia sp. Soil729]|uniref:TIGR03557 family F420-dependent LLM class oxidoreductase n=1 Tax=Knoellia sp. Soil729 TaxID=1736394 RepID=UPI0006FF578C|nr:TIGR03557 family F420-dependent LLM class oxidoreductase [Knoellia sp. Soil729]KRE43547.1 LLM class F420-dependent oxidoreductase [Knoellia sp. Soil729]
MQFGYFLSCEEYSPAELVDQAVRAEAAGFDALSISDHFHPWNDEQGQSPFVWSVIGAIAQACSLPVLTAVTCPTVRVHPVVIAQAAATSAVMLDGRFVLGVGSGEALNEHVTGSVWPHAEVRLEMLEEAVGIIRALFTGEQVSHRGRHYTVDTARLYTVPSTPPPIYVSAFGPKALELAARIGDGWVTTSPDQEGADTFRSLHAGAPAVAALKVAYAPTRDEGVDHAHRLWSNAGVPGELAQVLPTPAHFEQASSLVTREATSGSVAAGSSLDEHLEAFEPYLHVGFDTLYVANMGPHYRDMIEFYGREVLPALRDAS